MLGYFNWDPPREMIPISIPGLDRAIVWYGFFFALGVFLAFLALKRSFDLFFTSEKEFLSYRDPKIGKKFLESICTYVIIGGILGAKLGEVLFYQDISHYLRHPLEIFAFWKAGLASHGGVLGVFFALFILSKKSKISWIRLVDLCVIPGVLAGSFIRIGNFFNQEILGTFTSVPWAISFGHPADGVLGPRHPVQIYESIAYFSIFYSLWYLCKKHKIYQVPGKLSGFFFMLVFGSRFLLEFFKVEQSIYSIAWNMGQYLSLPLFLAGLYFAFRDLIFHKDRIKSNHGQ